MAEHVAFHVISCRVWNIFGCQDDTRRFTCQSLRDPPQWMESQAGGAHNKCHCSLQGCIWFCLALPRASCLSMASIHEIQRIPIPDRRFLQTMTAAVASCSLAHATELALIRWNASPLRSTVSSTRADILASSEESLRTPTSSALI